MSFPNDVAVVICHGSYHSPKPYEPLVDALKDVGMTPYRPYLPTADLSKLNANGQRGGIIGMLYIRAFIIPVGESIHSLFQPKDGTIFVQAFMEFHKHGVAGLSTIVDAEEFFLNDKNPKEAKEWATTLTGSPILTTNLTNDAYATFPCAYLILEGDLILPNEY
ncbi:hypothetical protein PG987_004994 [Apiospora arundinis]